MPEIGLIIAAGGSGRRFGGGIPKQFRLLGRRSVLEHSLRAFEGIPRLRQAVVAVPPGDMIRRGSWCLQQRFRLTVHVVAGGRERQDSVRNALRAFSPPVDVVLIHDAVRPLVDRATILRVMRAAARYGAAVPGVSMRDTVKQEGRPGFVGKTLDRTGLWSIQTPQGFRRRLLVRAHGRGARMGLKGTDDAFLAEVLGIPVRIVEGSRENLKITTPEDLRWARALLRGRSRLRTGRRVLHVSG
ncbi:MAG: 2-C-methyl-D-erythritol 4-phosphate cytidylyltransferase [Bacteroidota bacterium]